MKYIIFDLESDGLLDNVTKIYCVSFVILDENFNLLTKKTLYDYEKVKKLFEKKEEYYYVGHNIILYDLVVLEKLLGLDFSKHKLIDTLALSWYLYSTQKEHGLEHWGKIVNIEKPYIEDWQTLKISDYSNRCENDVKINTQIFIKFYSFLLEIYEGNVQKIINLCNYFTFKLDCIKEQFNNPIPIDIKKLNDCKKDLENLYEEKANNLKSLLPKVNVFKEIKKPKLYKKDGSLSEKGKQWLEILKKEKLKEDWDLPIKIVSKKLEPNPKSSEQIKNWLYMLGWKPITFEDRTNTKGEVNKVPQIYDGDSLCDSVKKLAKIEPGVLNLDMLGKIKHRMGMLKSFTLALKDNKVRAEIIGITPSFRFRHKKPIANIPKVGKFYGKEIRGLLTVPNDDYLFLGCDMSALEDTTKQHYMYFYDPEYVTQMRVPGFDPHIDIGVFSKLMSVKEGEYFKTLSKKIKNEEVLTSEEKAEFNRLNGIRSTAKTVNFAGIYGAAAPKLSLTIGCDLDFAKKLHSGYWERNKAVKQAIEDFIVKEVEFEGKTTLWVQNPISKYWLYVRNKKDLFSVVNQNSGVYCFDLFLYRCRKKGLKLCLQYHDELGAIILSSKEKEVSKILDNSIEEVNNIVKLNVPLGISKAFGKNYADVH